MTIVIISIAVALCFSVASNKATAGNTAEQLSNAGYFCVNAGPSNWLHCLRPNHFGNPTVPVKVFSEDGMEFKGTELLLRPDIYAGQPCPQDGLDMWGYNEDLDYMACHHFHTGHH